MDYYNDTEFNRLGSTHHGFLSVTFVIYHRITELSDWKKLDLD